MKRILMILGIAAFPFVSSPSAFAFKFFWEKDATEILAENPNFKKIALSVPETDCRTCAPAVERALEGLDGMSYAEASLNAKKAEVIYDPEKLSVKDLINATTSAGYPSTEFINP